MGSESWVPTSALPLRVAQLALLARLALLLVLELAWVARGDGVWAAGVVLTAAVSYLALRSPRFRAFLARHPLVVLLDVVLVAVVVGIVGVDTPFVLALATSALLVGLWLPAVPGLLVVSILVAIDLTLLTGIPLDDTGIVAYVIVIPAILVTLWLLGLAIQGSGAAEARVQASLRDAMSMAATAQERGRIAREMHDTIAKSLQAMALTAASIPGHLDRDPQAAVRHAAELEQDCTAVIAQVRDLMGELRAPAADVPFAEAVAQVVDEWRSSTGRRCLTRLSPVDVTDGLVRYELLMALREALDNVRQHAGRCTTRVTLEAAGDRLVLAVVDDGSGSDPDHVTASPERGHFGVVGMRERMVHVGGAFRHETGPGSGTSVTFEVHRRGLVEKEHEVVS